MVKNMWWFSEPDSDSKPQKFGPYKTKRAAKEAANIFNPLQRIARGLYRVRGRVSDDWVWKGDKPPWE